MKTIKPLTLEIEKEIWEQFKAITPKSLTLNQAVIKLIQEEIKRKNGKI